MLLEFGFKNYFSFREGMVMSLRLDAKCPAEVSNGLNFTPVICVKGANASGKTQVLKALAFLGGFCTKSFEQGIDEIIPVMPFYNSPEPTELYAEFASEGNEYRYELSVTSNEVKREALYRTKNRQVRVFERLGNEITYAAKSITAIKGITLRKNASLISTVHQHKFELSDFDEAYAFFRLIITNVSAFSGLMEKPRDINTVSKFLFKNPEIFEFVKDFIKECDTGIGDIKIVEVADPDSETRYSPVFYHDFDGNLFPVPALMESSGTKALYRDLATYHLALRYGGIALADEMDINLHPYLLTKIVNLFLDKKTNPDKGQLIFSTHNTEVIDQMGRYRTYLVNKEANQSFSYRLDEIPGDILRNDRPISPAYKEGKIGGIPRV